MEKLANNLNKQHTLKKQYLYLIIVGFLLSNLTLLAQTPTIQDGKVYTVEAISVAGNTNYSSNIIIAFSGLTIGTEIILPTSKEIETAIKKLWESKLFSSVDIYITKVNDNNISLEIELTDLPQLEKLTITGVKKSKFKKIIEENKLQTGSKVTENLITNAKTFLEDKYRKRGYLNAKVNIKTADVIDSLEIRRVNMDVNIDKGRLIKIKDITLNGNEKFTKKKLRKLLRKTKKRNFIRFYKRSKYIESNFKEDLAKVINKYKEKGYRDARILSDSLIKNSDNTISLNINLAEGEKYTFGDITFLGNTVYTDQVLGQVLTIKKGDVYNGIELQKRIQDQTRPDANDLANLYQNNGYLFSRIIPVETKADGNIIDMEIRIVEGKPAYINKVKVSGNLVTNDKIIYREMRIRPGQLYNKANILRTRRDLGQLGFFDAEQIAPEFANVNQVDGTLDIEIDVVETGSSQIQLQGGFGGGGFIGTLGLSFNNFSIKNIFNKSAYKPVPRGDGQSISLQLQASRFFQTYSFSFSEPWLGGKRPVRFTGSISRSTQFQFNPLNRDTDRDSRFNITGISLGIQKRLSIPDDSFLLSQALSYQNFDLQNFNSALFTFGNGSSNNLAYTVSLRRNDTRFDPIYPTAGSDFTIEGKFTLPYSAFNGVDYSALRSERDAVFEDLQSDPTNQDLANRLSEIDQERFNFLEFYKINFRGLWYSQLTQKLILRPSIEFGFLGAYNNDRGVVPFERFFLGGDGLGQGNLDGRETIALRGYANNSLTPQDGSAIYNKFSLELRYPLVLKGTTKIYALGFVEAGNAYENFREFNPFNVNRSAGAGARIFLPTFGLLGIDFGYGFDPLPGQTRANGLETHFIIGQQF